MPRKLILVPRPRSRVIGATTIELGYTKGYTPDEMRMWADDLDRSNRTASADLERWRATPPDRLSNEQRRVLAVRDKCLGDWEGGINGSLRPDQKVELDGGRHRAGYMLERGVDPVPVWVWAREQRDLDTFSAQCDRELRSTRDATATRDAASLTPRTEQRREPDRGRDVEADSRGDRARA
jgi:hypothetical protein